MFIKVDRDILIGCADLIKHYFIVQEFSGTKVSSYDKALYNALLKSIKGKKRHELFK
jgi:hypothetical protein